MITFETIFKIVYFHHTYFSRTDQKTPLVQYQANNRTKTIKTNTYKFKIHIRTPPPPPHTHTHTHKGKDILQAHQISNIIDLNNKLHN